MQRRIKEACTRRDVGCQWNEEKKGSGDTKSPTATVTMEIECPHCKKGVVVKRFRERVKEPVLGEYDEYNTVEKNPQQGFGFSGGAGKKKTTTTSKKTRKIGGSEKSGGKKSHEAARS